MKNKTKQPKFALTVTMLDDESTRAASRLTGWDLRLGDKSVGMITYLHDGHPLRDKNYPALTVRTDHDDVKVSTLDFNAALNVARDLLGVSR